MAWQTLSSEAFALGESPFWHPTERKLYWVDISGKNICRSDLQSKTPESWHMPSEPGCIAPMQGGGLVIALRQGVFTAPVWGGELCHLLTLPYDGTCVRANDGKCDAKGRFWVGTVDETKTQHAAALYCIDCSSTVPLVVRMLAGATTANGLAWSPDGQTLYWADTPNHSVQAWHYDGSSNSLQNQRNFAKFVGKPTEGESAHSAYQGRPDGAAVDVHGNYYVALYEGACVAKFAPNGALLARYATPVQCPTMPCFGGDDLKTLFVTSARQGRSSAELAKYPQSGCIFYQPMDLPGMPVNFFQPFAGTPPYSANAASMS